MLEDALFLLLCSLYSGMHAAAGSSQLIEERGSALDIFGMQLVPNPSSKFPHFPVPIPTFVFLQRDPACRCLPGIHTWPPTTTHGQTLEHTTVSGSTS